MSAVERVPLGAADGRRRWVVEHGSRRLLVLLVDGDYLAIDAVCPHRQGSLERGRVRRGAIVCPVHSFAFDLHTGRCRTAARLRLQRYPVTAEGGLLYAEIAPARWWPWHLLRRRRTGSAG